MEQNQINQETRRFDMDAGHLCLDFANTMDWHASSHPEEELSEYADLLVWGREAGLISQEEEGRLLALAGEQPEQAARWLTAARDLREAIYRIFTTVPHGESSNKADLELLNRCWHEAVQSKRLAHAGGEFKWEWQFHPDDLGRVLWPVTDAAVSLLESDLRLRVGQCEDDRGCGFLFLDTSRNRSRRWCSMDSCGNRAKAHRHYKRGKPAGRIDPKLTKPFKNV